MTRMKRVRASRKGEETTSARVTEEAEAKGEAERYAGAFERVRFVRAWIAVVAAILAVLSVYLPLLERVDDVLDAAGTVRIVRPQLGTEKITTSLTHSADMSARGDDVGFPTREQVERKLLDLITGKCDRRQAADWASHFVDLDVAVSDRGIWNALVALSGADLRTTDREFLHGEADFCVWLEQLKRSARRAI